MIYFNRITNEYEQSLRDDHYDIDIFIRPLDHWENCVGEIKADIVKEGSSISVNKGNGARRSTGFSLILKDEYIPSKNSYFWYNRKFMLVAEHKAGDNIYRFPLGVFLCSSASELNGRLTLSGVDKYASLNGESNVGKVTEPFSTNISAGDIMIGDLIRELLLQDIGNGLPIDPIAPLIDPYFNSCPLYADVTLSIGQYYGELITQLAQMYGADCYYNTNGQLVFRRKPTVDQPYWYMHMGYLWRYKDQDETVISKSQSTTYSLDGINCVTVSTDNSEGTVYSYTARNKNAESPINVKAIGERYPSDPIVYISLGDTSGDSGEEKCRQYAEYLLLQKTRNTISENFSSILIPHFDVDRVIRYKDEDYIIDSLNLDLAGRKMTVGASNVSFLPQNWGLTSYE